jgi:hypothetical protein
MGHVPGFAPEVPVRPEDVDNVVIQGLELFDIAVHPLTILHVPLNRLSAVFPPKVSVDPEDVNHVIREHLKLQYLRIDRLGTAMRHIPWFAPELSVGAQDIDDSVIQRLELCDIRVDQVTDLRVGVTVFSPEFVVRP